MSSRRSETDILPEAAAPVTGSVSATPRRARSGWWDTLKSNAPVPVVIALLALLTPLIEQREFAYYGRMVMLVAVSYTHLTLPTILRV